MTQEDFFKRYTYTPSRDRIGGGGFGTVYKAKDNVLHREVAIKVSEVKTTADGKKTFSLKDEFEALAHVPKHPNIANYEEFYSYESPQGLFDYAVMQYYPDGNLSNAIKQGLTAEQKEDIATQLLEGIDFLHKHKVIHRDLKPGNILIVKDESKVIPLITDFGLSKAAGVVDGSVFSNSFGAGTPRYSSPEQLQGNPLRLNTDLWSYGAILYELFTGEQLFTAGSGAANTAQADMEVYNKIVNGNVQSLGRMPEKWRKVAERCLVVDPTKRAKDAAELFAIIKGDEDETELTGRESPQPPFVKGEARSDAGAKPNNPILEPRQASPSERGAGGSKTPLEPTAKPKNKKALWIGLGIAAAVVVALLLLLKPKPAPTPTDPDTQAYEACQTVADYRAYMSDYGRNALHYADAKAFVDQFVADSIEQARQAQAMVDAAQKQEAERQAQAEAERKEEAAYKKCTTIEGCNAYLKAYPKGRYVDDVNKTKAELETQAEKPEQPPTSQPSGSSITVTANGVSFVMKKVAGGTFQMGATSEQGSDAESDEKPVHSVTLSSYYIGETEVTQALWKAVMGNNPSYFKGDNLPVERVSWNDCQEFIRKLNQKTGKNFRLPTEAEWEFAARGGAKTSLYNGENIIIRGKNNSPNLDALAWYGGNCGRNYTIEEGCDVSNGYDISGWDEKQYSDSKGGTHPVKKKQPNAYGLYDMLGNVWEWCSDWYGSDYYGKSPSTNPQGPSSGSYRVLRGGGWHFNARSCRVSSRDLNGPDRTSDYIGFRLALPQ